LPDEVTKEAGWRRKFLFRVFRKSVKPLLGRGIGARFPLTLKVCLFLLRLFSVGLRRKIILTEVEGIKLYFNPKSTSAPSLMIKGSYEKGTTKLFNDFRSYAVDYLTS
jgi:hypothetical protein